MSSRASAARYARALLDVVIAEGNPEKVEQELTAIADLIAAHADLQRALTNPAVPVSGKRGVVDALAAKMQLSPPLAKLLRLLADRERLSLLPDLAEVYRERLMEHRQVVRADVTTATALPPDRVAKLQERLAQATGRRVTMTTRVDPSLIGGAITRVGSIVYDSSVATQLSRIRQRLEEQR